MTARGSSEPTALDPVPLRTTTLRPRVRRRRLLLVLGLVILGSLTAFALCAPLFGSPTDQDFTGGLSEDGLPLPPDLGSEYPLGTDTLGRDMLARLAYGGRVSLLVAAVSTVTSLTVALAIGLTAGFFRRADAILMRATDVALAFPGILAALVLAGLLPAGVTRVIVIITVLFWAYPARLVYGDTLRVRGRGFVEAAEAAGSPGTRTIRLHVLPHVFPLLLAYVPLGAAAAILFESTLSFIGAGISLPTPSWGNMIQEGQRTMSFAPHMLIEPSVLLAAAILAFLLIGQGLVDREGTEIGGSWLDI